MRRKRKTQRSLKTAGQPSVDLDLLIATFGRACGSWDSISVLGSLVRARLADHCRDAGVRPVSETAFESCWSSFDDEHQQRFAVLISACELDIVAELIPIHCAGADDALPVVEQIQKLTKQLELLPVELLLQSDIRLEEFSRHFCKGWGLDIEDESKTASAKRLNDIDFSRLLQEAEQARTSAQDRLEYLRELQQEEEKTRRPRRGKW